jgi:uncharacterized SAM-binding protein YcdF (DUF218 family)
MRKWVLRIAIAWMALVVLPSVPAVRVFLASPLVVTDAEARGDACYVLASGDAWPERLAAASDLYHMGRTPRIILMRSNETGPFNFVAKKSWTPTDWSLDFLTHRGVPQSKINIIEETQGMLGTLAEAKNLSHFLPPGTKKLVLVSSAPHMRRTMLAFGRVFPPEVELIPYAASDFFSSAEHYRPIWLEYLKLGLYSVVARP